MLNANLQHSWIEHTKALKLPPHKGFADLRGGRGLFLTLIRWNKVLFVKIYILHFMCVSVCLIEAGDAVYV